MMRIQVLHDYRGQKTGQELIRKGEYDAVDPRVYGIADYLVNNGHARVLETPPAPVIEPARVDIAEEPVEAQETALADDSAAFEEIPNTRAVKPRKAK